MMEGLTAAQLIECFASTYTADLKDFHSIGVACTHSGAPLSVIAKGLRNKLPAFKNVTKKQGQDCLNSMTELCKHMLR